MQSRLVKGEGPKDAQIMFVGEAPGREEARAGRPFVGSSGQLLDQLMHGAGIIRRQCYITNVVKERPKDNNIRQFIDVGKRRVAPTAEYQAYEESLASEIEEVNPSVIVAVGAVPLWALCRRQGITKWRGSVLPCTLVQGYKVIPIIHPAGALRNYIWRYHILFDLTRIKRESWFRDIRTKSREYTIAPSWSAAMDYLSICLNKEFIAFDIEVSNEQVSCISFSHSATSAISIPFTHNGRDYFTLPQEIAIWNKISEILGNPDIKCIAQNAMFDASFLFRRYGIRTRSIDDTMVAQGILHPDFSKGLDFITSIYTDIPYYKEEGKYRITTGGGSDEEFWLYNAKDAVVLMEAFPKQVEDLKRQKNYKTYVNQAQLIEPLLYMTRRGVKMDAAGLKRRSKESEREIKELSEELKRLCGYDINHRSPSQLKEYFYEKKKIRPLLHQGRPTTNEKALKRLAVGTSTRPSMREADILLSLRRLEKMNSTYYKIKLDDDDRLRCSMNPVGTRYGRFSSSKTIFGTGANMQNLPFDMKAYMLPDDGYVAYEVDLSQAENRIVAYLGPDLRMIDAFENGKDIHRETAALIFGKSPKEISSVEGSSSIGGGTRSERYWGKTANHALNYGMSPRTFSIAAEITEKEARYIHDRYHSGYPGVRKMQEMIKEILRKNNTTLTNLFGRKYTFKSRWGDDLFRDAFAFIPQSTVADKINRHGILYIYYNNDLFHPVELLNQIHDSILFQIPLSVGWEEHCRMLKLLVESLESPLEWRGRSFKIPAEVKMLPVNMRDGVTVSPQAPENLEEAYAKARSGLDRVLS